MVIDRPAIGVGAVVGIPDGSGTEVRQVVSELLEVLLVQDLCLLGIGASGHSVEFYSCFSFSSPRGESNYPRIPSDEYPNPLIGS